VQVANAANSAAITPATNRSVLVMGCCTTTLFGVGQVSLLHIPSAGMRWVGLESPLGATTAGFSSGGDHIVYIDSGSQFVDIRTASANTILIRNASAGTLAGNVTLIW